MSRLSTGTVATALAAGLLTAPPAHTTAPTTESRPQAAPAEPQGTMRTPLVIGHRGASGYRPEHTVAAYRLAVSLGADVIEPDLTMTKDGVLVARHEPEISGTTDIAERPEFANRRTTKLVDGVAVTGWFVDDLTLAEVRTLRAIERLPELRSGSAQFDGRFPVPTLDEVLALRSQLSRESGRTIGVIPEIKHSTYLRAQGLNAERALVRAAHRYGLNTPRAPLWTQSFEFTNLVELRETYRYRARLVFLATAAGGPYDLAAQGRPQTYAELLAPENLVRLAGVVDTLGPEKTYVIPRNADGTLGTPTTFVDDAHAAGLAVVPFTFRAENSFLPVDYRVGTDPTARGRAVDEVTAYLRAGIDGAFCDQPDVCVDARATSGIAAQAKAPVRSG
ncbi:MAG: glycerophosphodiester phosphodiesterase [Dermatophilaceae bacterium]